MVKTILCSRVLGTAVLLVGNSAQAAGSVSLVSVSDQGVQANADCFNGYLAANGTVLLFESQATNLVVPDSNGNIKDVFLRHLAERTTAVVSLNSQGEQASGNSHLGACSIEGRFVAFGSSGLNMPGGSTSQVYVRDRWTRVTELASVAASGAPGNQQSIAPRVSSDGRFVAFTTAASNIIGSGLPHQVCLRDRWVGSIAIVSLNSRGNPVPSWGVPPTCGGVSDDGRYTLFKHAAIEGATFYHKWYMRDVEMEQTILVTQSTTGEAPNGSSNYPAGMSSDGRFVLFTSDATNLVPGDTNGKPDAFLRDLILNTTTRISVAATGEQANGSSVAEAIAPNGRYLAFRSDATNLVKDDLNGYFDVFVLDRWTGTLELVTRNWQGEQLNHHAFGASISNDGRVVGFSTQATNVVSASRQRIHCYLCPRAVEAWGCGSRWGGERE